MKEDSSLIDSSPPAHKTLHLKNMPRKSRLSSLHIRLRVLSVQSNNPWRISDSTLRGCNETERGSKNGSRNEHRPLPRIPESARREEAAAGKWTLMSGILREEPSLN